MITSFSNERIRHVAMLQKKAALREEEDVFVAEGLRLKAPYHLTWSCYEGGEKPCGACGTCRDRAAAFAANGITE